MFSCRITTNNAAHPQTVTYGNCGVLWHSHIHQLQRPVFCLKHHSLQSDRSKDIGNTVSCLTVMIMTTASSHFLTHIKVERPCLNRANTV
jgi:hypothetical protein